MIVGVKRADNHINNGCVIRVHPCYRVLRNYHINISTGDIIGILF
jgi:hypothetical protein